jgi:hypothetical protein
LKKARTQAFFALGLHDATEGDERGIVFCNVDELPADVASVAMAGAVAGDAMA